jgi:hypothetical protein
MSGAQISHLDSSTSARDLGAALARDGAVIVEGLLGPDLLARFNAELDPLLAESRPDRKFLNPALEWFFGKRTRHLTAVAAHSRVFATEVLCHPLMLEVADAVLGPSCSSFQLNIAHVLTAVPTPKPSSCTATRWCGSTCRDRTRSCSSPR